MHEDTFRLWLRETGLRAPPRLVALADAPALLDPGEIEEPQPPAVADLDLVDPGDHDDDADDDRPNGFEDHGGPGDRWENIERVAAAFRAAGNPKYQDVRLKSAKTSHGSGPACREIALERDKRVNLPPTW
jgi:hypothetical protein